MLKKYSLFTATIIFTVCLSSNALAQICVKKITPQAVSFQNFTFPQPGQARDGLSKLVWDRCVYGQKWQNETCTGSPAKLTWQEALEIAENNDKRLPNIKELNSILDLQCIIPPSNLTIFPNTPGSNDNGLWSSTPYASPDTNLTSAWYIDLGFGLTSYRGVDTKNFVRFINKCTSGC